MRIHGYQIRFQINFQNIIILKQQNECSPPGENMSNCYEESVQNTLQFQKIKSKSKSQSQGNELKRYFQVDKPYQQEHLDLYQDEQKLIFIDQQNSENDDNLSNKLDQKIQNYYKNKQINQSQMSLGDPQILDIKGFSIGKGNEKLNQYDKQYIQDQQEFQPQEINIQLNEDDSQIQQNNKNMHQFNYLNQNTRQNNRTLSEPNIQLRKKIISQISDVLIGISQSKLEDSFCQAINDIQTHIQTIQQRISVLEITFLNVSQKDQQVDQNKILIEQSETDDRHQSLNSTNIHSRLCNKKENFEKQVNEKLNSLQKQLEGVQETMEDKIVNLWKTVGFMNTKIEDLEILQLNTEELLKRNDDKTQTGFFKRKLFGF